MGWNSISSVVKRNFRADHCYACGLQHPEMTLHHLIPRARGGKDIGPNLLTFCRPCHEEWNCYELAGYEPLDVWFFLEVTRRLQGVLPQGGIWELRGPKTSAFIKLRRHLAWVWGSAVRRDK